MSDEQRDAMVIYVPEDRRDLLRKNGYEVRDTQYGFYPVSRQGAIIRGYSKTEDDAWVHCWNHARSTPKSMSQATKDWIASMPEPAAIMNTERPMTHQAKYEMDEEMSERERDMAIIEKMQQHIAKKVYEDEPQGDMFLISTNMRDIIEYGLAERRERIRLAEELKRLRTILGGVPEALESYAESVQPHFDRTLNPTAGLALAVIRAKADAIRAALESEVE